MSHRPLSSSLAFSKPLQQNRWNDKRMAEEGRDPEMESKKKIGNDCGRMAPWDQHAAVISLPRFDYNAPSSLLQRSHSGFLITCTIKREKSATKEAISILQKYVGSSESRISKFSEDSDAMAETKRRKISTEETNENIAIGSENRGNSKNAGGLPKDDSSSVAKMVINVAGDFNLSLVKLTRSGLLLFTFSKETSPDTVNIVSDIFHVLESGSLKSPQWCHRFFPIQATCSLNEKELGAVVSKLVLQFMNDKQNKLVSPIKFAVGFNRRGMEESQVKLKNNEHCALLDRNKCFAVVAGAVKDVISDAVVDLKSPELSILVELLPITGVPNASPVVAVSALPQNLVITKPRLSIKPLVSD